MIVQPALRLYERRRSRETESMTTEQASPSPTNNKAEQKRGYKEASRQFEFLRARWPQAFPAVAHEIRPLASQAKQALVEAFGWSPAYARAVLTAWKVQPTYCRAVLSYTTRIHLDGSPSDEEISDTARASARQRLEEIAARRAEKSAQNRLRAAAEASAQATKPVPPEIPDTTPEPAPPPWPPKPRKLVVAGSAAMEAALKRRLASGAVTTEILKTVPAATPSGRREHRAR